MKITAIKPFLVDRFLLVRVYTDEGIIGNGEAGLWANHEVVAKAIESLNQYFVEKDPGLIEYHHQVISRESHFMGSVQSAALSAIDVALWDIAGKVAGQPVYRLLGGRCRNKVKVFENVRGDSIEERVDNARQLMAQGFVSIRTQPFLPGWELESSSSRVIDNVVSMVAAIRDAVGFDTDFGVEIHRNLSADEAIILGRELETFRLRYYEDPLPPENEDALEYVSRNVRIPIAAGERSYNLYQFCELLGRRILGFVRADLSLAGGFTQCKKIAALAEAHFVQYFPHLMGSPVNTAAYLQLDAAIPNYFAQEANIKYGAALEIVDTIPEVVDGFIAVSDRPGIGIDINEKALSRFPFEPHNPVGSYNVDGSVRH